MRCFAAWCVPVLCGLVACADVVDTTYATKVLAQEGGLIARGWLPDYIPDSSTDIRTINDLDLNTSHGSFKFKPEDWRPFMSKLRAGDGQDHAPFVGWQSTVGDYRKRGYTQWATSDEQTTWIFFCRQAVGQCDYVMWLARR